jgi:signal transduction histidine kinase
MDMTKNMPKSLELLDVSITIHDVLRFLSWFFAASSVESLGFNFPLSLRFYLHTSIQIQFTLVLNQGKYLLYLSFECVEDKLALGETNNKLNYSYLLLCSLSHELLTPLNQLMLISEQLTKKLDSSTLGARRHVEVKQEGMTPSTSKNSVVNYAGSFAKMVEDSAHINLMARGLSLTVQNFLDFAKYIIRTLKVIPRPLDLAKIIADTVCIVQLKLQKKGLSVKVDVQCDAHMVSDEDKLTGLLYTFLDNAVKYTQQGGISLTVKTGHTPDHLRFEVADTGIGIDEEDMFKISSILENPFVDLKTRYSAGIGIGLRVAQVLIMYLSGGDIELNVSSLKGHGTTISFEILRHAKEFEAHNLYQTQKKSIENKSKQMQEDFEGKINQLTKNGQNYPPPKHSIETPEICLPEIESPAKKAPSPMQSGININPLTQPDLDVNLAEQKKQLLQKKSSGVDLLRAKVNKLITTSIVVKAFTKNKQDSHI